tara:strand:+ start:47 stop:643 length:597 start_codon:yes stop_codon:yes gene_type:complete
MKYPRLPEKLDKRKKLMEKDKEDIRLAYKQAQPFPTLKELHRARKLGLELQSRTDWYKEVAEMYSVNRHSIHHVTEPDYNERRRQADNEYKQEKYKRLDEHEKQALLPSKASWQSDRINKFPVQKEYYIRKRRHWYRLNKKKEKQINLFDEFKEMFAKEKNKSIEEFKKRPHKECECKNGKNGEHIIGYYFTKIKENK